MPQYLCLVDEKGRFLREEERETCHLGDGLLHRAFLVIVFNENNELLLARRSAEKKLWPGFWDGTVASHYYKDKAETETIMERLHDEIGVGDGHSNLEFLFAFRYHARYKEIGSEKEICDVYKVSGVRAGNLAVAEAEISAAKFVNVQGLKEDMAKNAKKFTPWFVLAFQMLLGVGQSRRS